MKSALVDSWTTACLPEFSVGLRCPSLRSFFKLGETQTLTSEKLSSDLTPHKEKDD